MSSSQRIIPAPIGDDQTARIKQLAEDTFTALGLAGVTRVDMLVDAYGHIFVNEPNTIPGSFAFYLWEPVGMPFADLMDELITFALDEHAETARTTRTFESNLLAGRVGGAKA
jgi:D-alanine-D-alanine ligase